MKKCENCGIEHDGSYGSGRFCSDKCAKSFSTKNKRKEINEKISKTLTKEPYIRICKGCKEEFKTKKKHQIYCSSDCVNLYVNTGRTPSEETRKKLSLATKKSYKEGKQVYGGTSKWYDYKNIRVQGTYELRTCKILDKWKEQGKIKDWEYTNDRVQYIGVDEKKHTYLLDFKVFENNNSFYYLETKGWEDDNDKLKWKAVENNGDKLKVWFNKDISEYEKILR